MRKISIIIAFLLVVISASSCSSKSNTENPAANVLENSDSLISMDSLTAQKNKNKIGYQLENPEEGEEIAVVTMSDGRVFKMRFFADEAPKTVYNFKYHAINGYFDGLTFHRVIESFMIQGGDPLANSTGGESVWGEPFEDEFNENLLNIDGAVAMANGGANSNGSQFFINATNGAQQDWDGFEELYAYFLDDPSSFESIGYSVLNTDLITDEYKALYDENGGNTRLDGAYASLGTGHTVFAQVFEGMDVVNEMSLVEVDSDNKPLEDLVVESIEIVKYEN